jgi:hypothetical protein
VILVLVLVTVVVVVVVRELEVITRSPLALVPNPFCIKVLDFRFKIKANQKPEIFQMVLGTSRRIPSRAVQMVELDLGFGLVFRTHIFWVNYFPCFFFLLFLVLLMIDYTL